MRIWHPSMWQYLPQQFILGMNKEFGTLTGSHIKGYRHSTVQYLLDGEIEKVIALRLKFYDFVIKNNIFKINQNLGAYNYINGNIGFSYNINIKKVKYWYKQERIYINHDDEYLIECLDNLWYKMTGDTLRWDGKQYPIKTKKSLCDMFKKHFKWYIDMKSEQLSEVA